MKANMPIQGRDLLGFSIGIFLLLLVGNIHIAIAFLLIIIIYKSFDVSKKAVLGISIIGVVLLLGYDFIFTRPILYAALVPIANWFYFFQDYYKIENADFSGAWAIIKTINSVPLNDETGNAFIKFLKDMLSFKYSEVSYLSSVIGWALIPACFISYQWKKLSNIKAYHDVIVPSFDKQGKKMSLNSPVSVNNGFVLGKDSHGREVLLSEKAANTHTLVVGTTGAGKTNTLSLLVEGAIEKNWPIIFVDGKGDESLGKQMAEFSTAQERPFSYFSMNKDSNVYYNPLVAGDYTSKKDRIITLFDDQNEYYKSIAEGYIQYVFEVLEKCDVTIDMYQASHYMQKEQLLKLLRESVSKEILNKEEAQLLSDKMKQHDAAQKDIASIATHINNICGSSSGEYFNTHGDNKDVITLSEILDSKKFIYFKLPKMKSDSFVSVLGKLIINDIKATLHDRLEKGDKSPVLIIFDEFSAFAGEQITSLLSQGRSTGAHCVIGTQGFADFQVGQDGESALKRLIQNINNYVIQQLGGYEDREIAAKLSGSKSTRKLTTQIGGDDSTLLGSLREGYEWNINPAEFDKLKPNGDAFFLSINDQGQKTRKRFQIKLSKITALGINNG